MKRGRMHESRALVDALYALLFAKAPELVLLSHLAAHGQDLAHALVASHGREGGQQRVPPFHGVYV